MKALPLDHALLPRAGNLAFGAKRSATHVHQGADLPRPLGTPVYAVADGTVEFALARWEQGFSGYGGHVAIAHYDGTRALYAHLDTVSTAKGRVVYAGEQIGTVGRRTGTKDDPDRESGGTHLHFEISPRPYPQASEAPRIDPATWLAEAIEPRIARAIAIAARTTGVDIALLRAVAWVQSKWHPAAQSERGRGLFGLTAAQASALAIDPLNVEAAASGAASLLRAALRRFGSVAGALAAFVWGDANVAANPDEKSWPAAVELWVAEVTGRWTAAKGPPVPFVFPGVAGSRS